MAGVGGLAGDTDRELGTDHREFQPPGPHHRRRRRTTPCGHRSRRGSQLPGPGSRRALSVAAEAGRSPPQSDLAKACRSRHLQNIPPRPAIARGAGVSKNSQHDGRLTEAKRPTPKPCRNISETAFESIGQLGQRQEGLASRRRHRECVGPSRTGGVGWLTVAAGDYSGAVAPWGSPPQRHHHQKRRGR